MVDGFEIIKVVSCYLRRDISVRLYRGRMIDLQLQNEVEIAQPIGGKEAGKASAAESLLSEIDALYAQFADGHLAEESMRHELAKLVLSETLQTQAVTASYSFLKPLFGSGLDETAWASDDAGNEQPNSFSRPRLVPVT